MNKLQNNYLQDGLLINHKLDHKIKWKYTRFPRHNSYGFIKNTLDRDLFSPKFYLEEDESKHSKYDEIVAKYFPEEISQIFDSEMLYKIPGIALSEIYNEILATFPISFIFSHIIEMKPLALWFSPIERAEIIKERLQSIGMESGQFAKVVNQQTGKQLSGMTGNRFQFINMLFDKSKNKLERIKSEASNLTGTPSVYLQNAEKGISIERYGNQFQSTKPENDKEEDRAFTKAMSSTHFWNWFEQRRVTNVSQVHSMIPIVSTRISPKQDIVSNSHNSVITSTAKSRIQGLKPGVPVHTHILTKISQRETEFPIVRIPGIGHHTGALKPMSEGSQPQGELKTIADKWLVSVLNQRFGESGTESKRIEPSPLNYAFAQPMHPAAQEEHVVTRVQEKEVVELIRKEIQSQMTGNSIVMNFSRADYARIADNVFSTLARRLTVEKERLGIH